MCECWRRDWKGWMEMHSDEDNAEEWEWEWNVGELENGLEKREREMQSDEDWF